MIKWSSEALSIPITSLHVIDDFLLVGKCICSEWYFVLPCFTLLNASEDNSYCFELRMHNVYISYGHES